MLFVAATLLSSAFMLPAARMAAGRASSRVAMMAAGNEAVDFPEMDGSEIRVGIIKARWHEDIIDELVVGVKTSLKECGVADDNIIVSEVPGSFELPLAARYMALSGQVDVVIPMGLLIKGARAPTPARASLPRRAMPPAARSRPPRRATPPQATPTTSR